MSHNSSNYNAKPLPEERILVATRSVGKQREIRSILSPLDNMIVFPDDLGLQETADEEDLERGASFAENATLKARHFAALSGLPTLADDSGIEVARLHGGPGIRSKRYAPNSEDQDNANNEFLIRQLEGCDGKDRAAVYRCAICFVRHEHDRPVLFEGSCTGYILETAIGDGGFGYDPLFFSDDLQMSFGLASRDAKEAVSHRGRAFRRFAEWIVDGS